MSVFEDPRIVQVEDALPSANCGGCGYAGCRNFAEACVKADSLSGLFCPPGGNETMGEVASILGMEATEQDPQVAVVQIDMIPDRNFLVELGVLNRHPMGIADTLGGGERHAVTANAYGDNRMGWGKGALPGDLMGPNTLQPD
ncbi:hypothetical protein LCGC14_2319270, partial [marine sediment metagenome]